MRVLELEAELPTIELFTVNANVWLDVADGRESESVSDRELTCSPLAGSKAMIPVVPSMAKDPLFVKVAAIEPAEDCILSSVRALPAVGLVMWPV